MENSFVAWRPHASQRIHDAHVPGQEQIIMLISEQTPLQLSTLGCDYAKPKSKPRAEKPQWQQRNQKHNQGSQRKFTYPARSLGTRLKGISSSKEGALPGPASDDASTMVCWMPHINQPEVYLRTLRRRIRPRRMIASSSGGLMLIISKNAHPQQQDTDYGSLEPCVGGSKWTDMCSSYPHYAGMTFLVAHSEESVAKEKYVLVRSSHVLWCSTRQQTDSPAFKWADFRCIRHPTAPQRQERAECIQINCAGRCLM